MKKRWPNFRTVDPLGYVQIMPVVEEIFRLSDELNVNVHDIVKVIRATVEERDILNGPSLKDRKDLTPDEKAKFLIKVLFDDFGEDITFKNSSPHASYDEDDTDCDDNDDDAFDDDDDNNNDDNNDDGDDDNGDDDDFYDDNDGSEFHLDLKITLPWASYEFSTEETCWLDLKTRLLRFIDLLENMES